MSNLIYAIAAPVLSVGMVWMFINWLTAHILIQLSV